MARTEALPAVAPTIRKTAVRFHKSSERGFLACAALLFYFWGRACKHPQGSLFGALFSLFSSQNLVLTGEERNRYMPDLAGKDGQERSSQFPSQDLVLTGKPRCPPRSALGGDDAGGPPLQFPAQDGVLSGKPKCQLVPDQRARWLRALFFSPPPSKHCFAEAGEKSRSGSGLESVLFAWFRDGVHQGMFRPGGIWQAPP